jgi:hypothetical protein
VGKARRQRERLARREKVQNERLPTCPADGKRCYASEGKAINAAATQRGGRAYFCDTSGSWHLTSWKRSKQQRKEDSP